MTATLAELEARLREPLSVHQRVRVLNEMAERLYEGDAGRGAELAKEAIELARATADAAGEAQGLYCLGRTLHAQGNHPGVFETQAAALDLFRALGNIGGMARVANLLGITHRQLSDYGRALEMYEAALRGFRETGDAIWQARVVSNIGTVEIALGNHEAALDLFEQAMALRRDAGDLEGAGFDLNNAAFARVQRALQLRGLGDPAAAQHEADEALELLDRSLASARQYGHRRLEAIALQTMGEAYLAMARPEVAREMAPQFLAMSREAGDRWVEAYGLACVGEIHHQMGESAEAETLIGEALERFEQLGSRDETARLLRTLSQVQEARGEYSQALASLRRAGTIEQRLRAEEAEGRARALGTRRRLEASRVESERYRRLADEDALTGLANRRQLDERLRTLMKESRRSGAVVSVALADVDHFKGINDRFSHAVGDEVLRCVGEILRSQCRLGDVAGRYGGQEFMVVFRSLEIRAAAELCERIRRAVEAWDWASIHPHLRVTLSMGLAASTSFDDEQGVLDAAHHWLYEAKHHGRNQVQPVMVEMGSGSFSTEK